jgi:tetratricopeptide (TPR) repeat protein
LNLADDQRRRGSYENALRYYSRALELDKSLVVGWVGQVQMLVQMDECPQAEVWSRKALELFPSHAELMAAQAQALCRLGDRKNAHAASDAALRQKGESGYRWLVRGEIMVAGKQATDLHCFDKAQQADDDWLVPLEAALIYLYYGIPSKAHLRARRAVERAPDVHYAWYVQGLCQSQLGFRSGARASMQRCLELCPRHMDAQRKLTELNERQWPLIETLRRLIGRS